MNKFIIKYTKSNIVLKKNLKFEIFANNCIVDTVFFKLFCHGFLLDNIYFGTWQKYIGI